MNCPDASPTPATARVSKENRVCAGFIDRADRLIDHLRRPSIHTLTIATLGCAGASSGTGFFEN
jgi:hypothetical protein